MDFEICRQFEDKGLDVSPEGPIPQIAIAVDESDKALIPGRDDPIGVLLDSEIEMVVLKPITQLYAGAAKTPSPSEIEANYIPFLVSIELTAYTYCAATGRIPPDGEFQRIYKQLRSKPDGKDRNPIFYYLQAAVRLFMSLNDVSKAEFRAVMARLAKSAQNFRMDKHSTNYFENALMVLGRGDMSY